MDFDRLPRHVAIIMDGNGRWAKRRGLPRTAGHAAGAETFRSIATYCQKIGLEYLTVYAFSTENWKRPLEEVSAIVGLLKKYLLESIEKMEKDKIKLHFFGDLEPLPQELKDMCRKTSEISERYEFMKTQHDDLVEAEAALQGIIEELDTGMRRQFEEKFQEIRVEFDKVFKQLFGGGKGTLELMEDEDVLEAGIRIISQPPGKKLQNMMQLSGGEKALTAIALLFAIQNLKPSPFCLLDEIEAALDDSNVDRFAQYLHKLTKHTQFIVITHRRGTMTAADRLYGITMQEKGISTLVSVDLLEEDLT
mgnify:FL=1